MRKRILSLLLCIVMMLSLIPTVVFAADITKEGAESEYFDRLTINGQTITECTEKMYGEGWAVVDGQLHLSGYNGRGIVAEMKERNVLFIMVENNSSITDVNYGIKANHGLVLNAFTPGTTLDIKAGYCGISTGSGTITINSGTYSITGNGSSLDYAFGKSSDGGFDLGKKASLLINWDGKTATDIYGISGLRLISGISIEGKLAVSVSNDGDGNAYAFYPTTVANELKEKYTDAVYAPDEQHFYVNTTPAIEDISATVTAPVTDATPQASVPASGTGYEFTIISWYEKDSVTEISGNFEGGKQYWVGLYVTPTTGYELAPSDELNVTVNGQEAKVRRYDGAAAGALLEFTFPATNTGHTHKGTLQSGSSATCTTAGVKDYYTCSCGKAFEDATCNIEIADIDAWKAEGGNGHIAPKGHTYGEWVITKEATESETGTKERTCTVCGDKATAVIPVLGHTHTGILKNGSSATCTAAGVKDYYTCSCGTAFEDATCNIEIADLDAWKAEGGNGYIAPKGHGETEVKNAKEATCTEAGYTGDTYCKVCGEKIAVGTAISAKGHSYGEWVTTKEATETETGTRERTCSVCGDKERDVIPVLSPSAPVKYTISYDLNGGTMDGKTGIVTLDVKEGTVITLPAPTREGYVFDYWQGSKYNAGDSYTVTEAHTFTAQWKEVNNDKPTNPTDPEPTKYTVKFEMNGHGKQIDAQTVEEGNKAVKPANPTESGYTFDGWYADSTFSEKFDFNATITANKTVYAKWTKIAVTPADSTSPKTGDNSHLFLWVALLFISGGALVGTAVYGKKRKYSAK